MAFHSASTAGEGKPLAALPLRLAQVRGLAVSIATAGLVAGGVLASGSGGPLPATPVAAAFLFLAVESDVRRLRIPNWLTLPALLATLAWQAAAGNGALFALAGAGTALAVLLPAWLGGFLGGGDVKATLPLGALWGAPALLTVLIWAALFGGVFGLARLLAAGALGELIERWRRALVATLLTRRPTWFPPQPGSAAAEVMPFAPLLGIGVIATQLFGAAWA